MKALLDTSFFIRLLNEGDPLQEQARAYLKHFINEGVELYISTIAISEFCVRGSLEILPLDYVRVLPFNLHHGEASGKLYDQVQKLRDTRQPLGIQCNVVTKDCKMFAQANAEHFDYFVSSDSKAGTLLSRIGESIHFRFIDISNSIQSEMGILY